MAETAPRMTADARREQVLACARRLFVERGFHAVSMTDVAREAGVARGLVNHHFRAKRDLELAVIREMLHVPPALPQGVEWDQAIEDWLDLVERHREAWFGAIEVVDPELRAVVDEAREAAGRRTLQLLGLPADDPTLRGLVRTASAQAEEATREWLKRGRLTREEVRALLGDALPRQLEAFNTRRTG